MIGDGPFKDGLEKDKTGIQRETYTRIVDDGGVIYEEIYTRQWFSNGDYVDHTSQMPISRSCWTET